MSMIGRALSVLAVVMLMGGWSSMAMAQGRFHAVTLVDVNNPVPAEWLQKAGIDYLYTCLTDQIILG